MLLYWNQETLKKFFEPLYNKLWITEVDTFQGQDFNVCFLLSIHYLNQPSLSHIFLFEYKWSMIFDSLVSKLWRHDNQIHVVNIINQHF